MQTIEKSIQVISEQLSNIMDEQMKRILEIDNQINQMKVEIYGSKTSTKQKDEILDKYIELMSQRDRMFTPFVEVQQSMSKTIQNLENLKWGRLHRFNINREITRMEKHILSHAEESIEKSVENTIEIPTDVPTSVVPNPIEGVRDVIKEIHDDKENKKEKVK